MRFSALLCAMTVVIYSNTARGLEVKAGCSLLYTMKAYKEAIAQCRKEAEEGRADAATVLSKIYKNGDGVTPNAMEAERWGKFAGQLEDANSKFRASAVSVEQHWEVCQAVYAGRGDHNNTIVSCQKAAEAGHLQAQRELAQRYALGFGPPEDHQMAAKWYRIAANQGDAESQYELAKRYSTPEISGFFAKRDQENWYTTAAKQGHVLAQYELATLNFKEGGTRYGEALKWYQQAAKEGGRKIPNNFLFNDLDLAFESDGAATVQSQYQLALIYLKGLGVPQDYSEALHWFRKAAEHGHMGAQLQLGQMYATGQGTAANKIMAHMWLNLAATGAYETSKMARSARDNLSKKMTPTEIERAQQLARKWSETMKR